MKMADRIAMTFKDKLNAVNQQSEFHITRKKAIPREKKPVE
jgi:hypothetical protein